MIKILRIVLGLIGLLVVVTFAVANRAPIAVSLAPLPIVLELPVYGVFLLGLVLGGLLGGIALWLGGARYRWRARRLRNQVGALEGQMAALAVSMLCAASLTYPWSRWRALVLDDPLQHNDAIHAAAFADLIGNLVKHKGYQVLLSSHDLAQAEFLRRKFDARHIPCAGLDLLGRGKEGVEWTFRPATAADKLSAASA